MKKTLFAILTLPALVLASCSSEEPMKVNAEGDGVVTLVAQLPGGINSRSFADGTTATQLTYAVYETGTTVPVIQSADADAPQATFVGLQAQLTLNLVKGKSYDIVFWADADGNSAYTFDAATQSVSISYDGLASNDETRDAFFQVEKGLAVNGPIQKTISLYRPFAQINFGTNDLKVAERVGVVLGQTKLTVDNVYQTLNLMTGVASDATEVVYDLANLPEDEVFPLAGYDYLSMNYLLTGTELLGDNVNTTQKELVNCTFDIVDKNGAAVNTLILSNVPVQRNYRTNIYGALLTSQVDYTIEIKPGFNDPSFDIEPVEEVESVEDFVDALANPFVETIVVPAGVELDLSDFIGEGTDGLTVETPKTMEINGTVKQSSKGRIEVRADLTVKGTGTIETGENAYGIFNIWDGATLDATGITIVHPNKLDGSPIAVRNGNAILKDVTIDSDYGTVMSWNTSEGSVKADNCTFISTSNSARDGSNWTYGVLIKGNVEAEFNNCTVVGTQGGLSASSGAKVVINGGTYKTVKLEDEPNANPFYAVYVAMDGEVTINSGDFSSADKADIYNGDNDVAGASLGNLIVKGGRFTNQGYHQGSKGIIQPAEGYEWQPIEGDDTYKWTVVKKN